MTFFLPHIKRPSASATSNLTRRLLHSSFRLWNPTNFPSHRGISSSRLELLEDRLKSDVIAELKSFDGRLLLHDEADGSVNPVWSLVDESSVKTLREIMDDTARKLSTGPSFKFVRVPITAEKSPDFFDVKEIVAIVAQLDLDKSAVIVKYVPRVWSPLPTSPKLTTPPPCPF